MKAIDEGLEGFVDWTNSKISKSDEKEEVEMFGLFSGFAARMRKQAASAQGEISPSAEAYGEKHPKLIGSDEEAQKMIGPNEEAQRSLPIINVDSPDRAFNA